MGGLGSGKPRLDLKGEVFGRLTLIEPGLNRGRRTFWKCQCVCGTVKEIDTSKITSGHTRSCGCYNKERTVETFTTHGESGGKEAPTKRVPLYRIWAGMLSRCYNKNTINYGYYGGRGITVCKEWRHSYIAFRDYMLSLPNCPENILTPKAKFTRSIDRIENDKGYAPGNVRWATKQEQALNTRPKIHGAVQYTTINGVKMRLGTAVKKHAVISYATVLYRLGKGWSMRDAFLRPGQRGKTLSSRL